MAPETTAPFVTDRIHVKYTRLGDQTTRNAATPRVLTIASAMVGNKLVFGISVCKPTTTHIHMINFRASEREAWVDTDAGDIYNRRVGNKIALGRLESFLEGRRPETLAHFEKFSQPNGKKYKVPFSGEVELAEGEDKFSAILKWILANHNRGHITRMVRHHLDQHTLKQQIKAQMEALGLVVTTKKGRISITPKEGVIDESMVSGMERLVGGGDEIIDA